MKSSELLKYILDRAEEIRSENECQHISAICILMAIDELCNEEYTGFTPYDKFGYPEFFEPERLHYLHSKLIKGRASFIIRRAFRYLKEKGLDLDTEFLSTYKTEFEALAKSRNKAFVSADIVYVYAIKAFEPIHHLLLQPEYINSFSVEEIISDIDKNIYDYVIFCIEKIKERLQGKADEAKRIRDWRPADKFMEPEQLIDKFFDSFAVTENGKSVDLTIPGFFGEDNIDLKLTVFHKTGIYYVHDNGCALAVLKKNAGEKYEKVLKKIYKLFGFDKPVLYGFFCENYPLFYFLKKLIFIANADLIYRNIKTDYPVFNSPEKQISDTDNIDSNQLISFIKQDFMSVYDENKGLILVIHILYPHSTIRASFQIETLSENKIRISDNLKDKPEGSVFDSFYYIRDDISSFANFISKFTKRFGGNFNGKDISVTTEITDGNYVAALLRFMNIAFLLSEFGCYIKLPPLRKRRENNDKK